MTASETTTNELDQVREILFGRQSRDHEARVANLEAHVETELQRIREESRAHLERLEESTRQANERLQDQLEQEIENRKVADNEFRAEIRQLGDELDQVREELVRDKQSKRELSGLFAQIAQKLPILDAAPEPEPSEQESDQQESDQQESSE